MRLRLLLIPLLLVPLACTSTTVVDRAPDGTPILIRGPLPDARSLENLQRLHGVNTVVNLRGGQPDEAWYRDEKRGAGKIGAKLVDLRVGSRDAPEPEKVDAFFDVVEDESNWPVLVHCQAGMHRTGLMVALYRMQYEGWSPEQAIADMERHGFDFGRHDRAKVKAFLRSYRPDPDRKLP